MEDLISLAMDAIPFSTCLNPARISFTAGGTKYTGTVDGNNINGSASGSPAGKWTAKKV